MDLQEFAFELYDYFKTQMDTAFEQTIYYGIAGRIVFIISFIIYTSFMNNSLKTRERFFWVKFIVKEAAILLLCLLNMTLAFFILAYSVVLSGAMLNAVWKKAENIHSKRAARTFSILLWIVLPVLATAGLTLFLLLGDELLYELIGVSVGIGVATISGLRYIKVNTLEAHLALRGSNIWNKSKLNKLVIILAIIMLPTIFYGIIYSHVFSFTWVFMVPMRDGKTLHTRVYLPPGMTIGEQRPVILVRTPYDAEGDTYLNVYVKEFTVERGYITVLQDLRGRCGSENAGPFPIFFSDADDGVDTINWIIGQPWCNGKIATMGSSADAANQITYHAEGPEGLVAAYLWAGPSELYDHWLFPGGCLRKNFIESWVPAVDGLDYYPTILDNVEKDQFWNKVSLTANNRFENVNVRAVHLGGWYDCFQQGTIDSFMYYNYNGTAHARDHQVLVMAPWIHGLSVHPSVDYSGLDQGYGYAIAARDFIFDEALLGNEKNWFMQPRVYYIMMGDPIDPSANNWRTSMDWPLTNMTYDQWYFHPNNTLSNSTPASSANLSFTYDPTDPLQTGGGTVFPSQSPIESMSITWGAYDNSDIQANRSDILKFDSTILGAPIEIAGQIKATLRVSSNCTDTDFTVKLLDVFPDGREIWVADGILKARYRNGFTSSDKAPMVPGQVYEIEVDMWSMAYRFSSGHKIQVAISSSNYPKYAANPNTGVDVEQFFTSYNIANNTVELGVGPVPSCVWLPRV